MFVVETNGTAEQRIADALDVVDGAVIRGVLRIMRDEVFMSTVDELDDQIFELGAEQSRAILYGRLARPYIGIELHRGRERTLCSDGNFADEPSCVARYPTEAAALQAAGHAPNRREGGLVLAKLSPYAY